MAARNVIDIALLQINGVDVQEVSSFEMTETDPTEAVNTMRRTRRAIGYRRGVPTFEIDLEVMMVQNPEINYLALKQANSIFPIFYEENAQGTRFELSDCTVTETSKSFNADGEAVMSVKILALDHREEPSS